MMDNITYIVTTCQSLEGCKKAMGDTTLKFL
jgi:hypothetical protein